MRYSPICAVLLAASCSPAGAENEAAAGAAGRRPAATVTVLSDAGLDCTVRWDGEAVSLDALLDKSVKLMARAMDEVGIDKVTEETLPYLRLEAAGDVPYGCTGPALRQMQRAGLGHVVLRPAGGSAGDQRADFPLDPDGPSPSRAIFRLAKGGRTSWDGAAVDRAGLAERARLARSMAPQVDLIVAPSPGSDFKTLHDALRAIEQEKLEAVLAGCAGTDGPAFATAPLCRDPAPGSEP